ncbi:probable disease resistance protein RXW24L [Aegilops tauschii subsp. strangulata]|nr:probable disease resistance protein RXW24L [Aegilops tauschii subsp. strangulata]
MDTSILTVLNKIGEVAQFAVAEYQRLQDVDKQVDDLCSKLEFLMAMIQVAEEGNRIKRDELVRVWVNHLRSAVFQAEDIADEYFQEVYQSRPGFERKQARRCPCIPCFNLSEVPVRYDLAGQIKELLGRLDDIQNNKLLNMRPRMDGALDNNIQAIDKPTIGTMVVEGRVDAAVGFDGYIKSIINLLLEDKGSTVVVVTGESGIGKSTAARAVLGDRTVNRSFDICVWVCLPAKSRVDKYLDQIWKQSDEQTHHGCGRSEFKQVLAKMKSLVVLDGMDSMDELTGVLRELPGGAKGSRIVVTTQLPDEEIKQRRSGVTTVEVKSLEQADCVEFLDKVFSGRCRRVYKENQDKFVDKIYKISGGLPLAVVLLGGLLYFKDHETQWNEVFDLLESYARKRLIKRLLTVSYATMPTILKSCFLYFAAMPPNVPLDLKKLHRLWSAEGIAESESGGGFTENEVLARCLRVLVSRGLVERMEDGTKICIHQSVHGFAKEIAHETGFMESDSKFGIRGASTVRGLSIHNYVDRVIRIDKENCFPKLRTLLGDFAEDSITEVAHAKRGLRKSRLEFLRHSKFLRVVDLHGVKLGTLPDSIGDMIHLRYLGLRSCCLMDLPPSVAKLLNLETLDITDNQVQSIVDEFWKIKKLKHVLAEKLTLPLSAASMDLVTELETLQGVRLSSQWTQENCPIKNMAKIFSLAVVGATAACVRLLAKALEEKRALHHLKIAGDRIPLLRSSRYQPLQYLQLDGKILSDEGAAQSYHTRRPITASRIVLRSSCMSQELLGRFLSQPIVNELELLDNSFTDLKLLLQGDAFKYLKKLKLGNLKELEELVIGESAVPNLMTLEIFGCPKLKKIQGLKNLEQLKNLFFFDMPEIVAQLEAVDKELSGKIKHVRTSAWASTT